MINETRRLLLKAVKQAGTYNPDEVLTFIEEDLTQEEYYTLYGLLDWCWKNNKTFGRENLGFVFGQYRMVTA